MALNPSILSVSAQASRPDERIHRYLDSVSPYVQQHAEVGQKSFEREVIRNEVGERDQQASSSQSKGDDRVPTWQELEERLKRRAGLDTAKEKEETLRTARLPNPVGKVSYSRDDDVKHDHRPVSHPHAAERNRPHVAEREAPSTDHDVRADGEEARRQPSISNVKEKRPRSAQRRSAELRAKSRQEARPPVDELDTAETESAKRESLYRLGRLYECRS